MGENDLKDEGKGTRILMFFVRSAGSLFLALGIVLFFIALFSMNLADNTAQLSKIAPVAADKYFEENKQEFRNSLGSQVPSFTKDKIVMTCEVDPSQIPGNICPNVQSMSTQEIRNAFIDAVAYEQIIQGFLSDDAQFSVVKDIEDSFLVKSSNIFLIVSLVLFVLGVLMIFISYFFKPLISAYKILSSGALESLLTVIAFGFINSLTPDKIMDLLGTAGGAVPGMDLSQAPSVVIKLFAAVFLEWLQLSIDPVFKIGLLVFVIFLLGAVLIKVIMYTQKKNKIAEKAVQTPQEPQTL